MSCERERPHVHNNICWRLFVIFKSGSPFLVTQSMMTTNKTINASQPINSVGLTLIYDGGSDDV